MAKKKKVKTVRWKPEMKKNKPCSKKKTKKECENKCSRPVSDYYNLETGEIYPKIFFRKDSLWDKIRRFFGYIP